LSEDQAGEILNLVLDSGINLIDTSIEYGMSEAVIGKFLGPRRGEYFLATKCGCPLDPPAAPADGYTNQHVFTREHIIAGVDQSLRKLRTDYLDLLQLHMSPSLSTNTLTSCWWSSALAMARAATRTCDRSETTSRAKRTWV